MSAAASLIFIASLYLTGFWKGIKVFASDESTDVLEESRMDIDDVCEERTERKY
jgi:hypothetical protein